MWGTYCACFFNLTFHFSEESSQEESRGGRGEERRKKGKEGERSWNEQQRVSSARGYVSILGLLRKLSRGPARKRKSNQFHGLVFLHRSSICC